MKVSRSKLSGFISKYNLGGYFESVKWDYKNKTLSTTFKSQDKSSLGNVQLLNVDFDEENFEIGINDTSKLSVLLNIFKDDSVEFDFVKVNDELSKISLYNDTNKLNVTYNLADLSILPQAGGLKQVPEFEVTTDCSFSDDFMNAYKALKSDTFSVSANKERGELKLILSEDSDPTSKFKGNQVTISVQDLGEESISGDMEEVYFDTELFKSILSYNLDKGATSEIKVSSKGLMKIHFESVDYKSTYYLVAKSLGNN